MTLPSGLPALTGVAPAPAANPDSGAAQLMGPGSIGQPQDPAQPAPTAGLTETEIYRQMLRDGTLARLYAQAQLDAAVKKIPGWLFDPTQLKYISVPNALNGTGSVLHSSGTSPYPSIETALMIATQSLVGRIATQGLTDEQVATALTDAANTANTWLGHLDQDQANIAALVAKYAAIYRIAVTPV